MNCPQCGEAATHQDPSGTYWDSNAHYWREPAAAAPTDSERLAEKLRKFADQYEQDHLDHFEAFELKPEHRFQFMAERMEFLRRECLSLMERVRTAGDLAVFIKDVLLPKLRIKPDLYEQEICGLERMLNGTHAHSLSKQLAEAMERVRTTEASVEQLCGDIKAVQKDYTNAAKENRALAERVRELEGRG